MYLDSTSQKFNFLNIDLINGLYKKNFNELYILDSKKNEKENENENENENKNKKENNN